MLSKTPNPSSGSTEAGESVSLKIQRPSGLSLSAGSSAVAARPMRPSAAKAGPLHLRAVASSGARASGGEEGGDKEVDSTGADQRA